MESQLEVREHGYSDVDLVQPLWESLFDHHLSIGAAGLRTIPREASWSRRRDHYTRLFAEQPSARFWIARLNGIAVGYAAAYETEIAGEPAMILETLSVLGDARGRGVGSLLMRGVDQTATKAGISTGVVEVMAGNTRTRELYLRSEYRPCSETWMLSARPKASILPTGNYAPLKAVASTLGFELSSHPGPYATWDSADVIVVLTQEDAVDRPEDDQGRRGDELADLEAALAAAGFWTIQCELPAGSAGKSLRELLRGQGFKLSTERLVRR